MIMNKKLATMFLLGCVCAAASDKGQDDWDAYLAKKPWERTEEDRARLLGQSSRIQRAAQRATAPYSRAPQSLQPSMATGSDIGRQHSVVGPRPAPGVNPFALTGQVASSQQQNGLPPLPFFQIPGCSQFSLLQAQPSENPPVLESATQYSPAVVEMANYLGSLAEDVANNPVLEVVDTELGTLPDSLSALTHLEGINLIESGLFESEIVNALPDLSRLQKLKKLVCVDIELQLFPDSIFNIAGLEHLDISTNPLNMRIPEGLSRLTQLKILALGANGLEGNIPKSFELLTNLENLKLYGNKLSGPIPDIFHNLPHLSILDLSDNTLSGALPESLGGLSELEELSLDNNTELTGDLPFLRNLKVFNQVDLTMISEKEVVFSLTQTGLEELPQNIKDLLKHFKNRTVYFILGEQRAGNYRIACTYENGQWVHKMEMRATSESPFFESILSEDPQDLLVKMNYYFSLCIEAANTPSAQ